MTSEEGPYYREPCGGWLESPRTSGPCSGHNVPADAAIPRLKNTTVVPDKCVECDNCEGDPPAPAPPEQRPACDEFADPPVVHCDPDPCGPWPEPVPENTYEEATPEDDPNTVDFSLCRKLGFKSVFAKKEWHGIIGLNAFEGYATCNGNGDCPSARAFVRDAIQEKYLTLNFRVEFTETVTGDGAYEKTAFRSGTTTINRYSGRATGSASEDMSDSYAANKVNEILSVTAGLSGQLLHTFYVCGPNGSSGSCGGNTPFQNYFLGAEGAGSFPSPTYTDGALASYEATNGSDEIYGEWDLAAGTIYLEYHGPSVQATLEIEANGNGAYYRYWFQNNAGASVLTAEHIYHAEYADPYTKTQLHADVDALLAEWNLGNDKLYPWRTDTSVRTGPLVSRNETPARAPFIWSTGYTDTDPVPFPSYAEGAIVGSPLPIGSDPYFNFYHIKWRFVDAATAGAPDAIGVLEVPHYYGQWSPFPHATQWVDNLYGEFAPVEGGGTHIPYLPAGPFTSLGTLINADKFGTCSEPFTLNPNTLWKCKWAEVIIGSRPSVNFFRPCGRDREEISTSDCVSLRWPDAFPFCGRIGITSATQNGGDVDIVLDVAAPYLATGDHVDFTGVGGLGSNVEVTVTDPTHFSVTGTLSGPYVIGGFIQANGSPSRFWNDDGRKGQFIVRSFTHNFRDFLESYNARKHRVGVIANNVASDPDCPVPDEIDPVRYIAKEPDDAEGHFNEIGTGSYWLSDATNTQCCTQFHSCGPSVVYISPNEETGHYMQQTIAMPAIELDVIYGGLWLARVEQWMTDPFWKPPGRDYTDIVCDPETECEILQEDDGTGREDYINEALQQVCIYPMRPWVEALTGLPYRETGSGPETAPDLPSDAIAFACDLVDNMNQDPPVGSAAVCFPHYTFALVWDDTECTGSERGHFYRIYADTNNEIFYPWQIQLAQESATRFQDEYRENGGHE